MQPISTTAQVATSSNPNNALRAPTRRGGVVNYAEGASDDEFGVDSEDDEDFTGVKGTLTKRSTPRLSGAGGFRVGSPAGPGSGKDAARQELDKSYLGLVAPSRYIISKNVPKTRHEYPCVFLLCHFNILLIDI
jgi:chromatin structure-remodeling complex subunit SFH1